MTSYLVIQRPTEQHSQRGILVHRSRPDGSGGMCKHVPAPGSKRTRGIWAAIEEPSAALHRCHWCFHDPRPVDPARADLERRRAALRDAGLPCSGRTRLATVERMEREYQIYLTALGRDTLENDKPKTKCPHERSFHLPCQDCEAQ